MDFLINGNIYTGKKFNEYGNDIINKDQFVIEIFVSYDDNNIQDFLNEASNIMIREQNKIYNLLKKKNIIKGIGAWKIDLRNIKDFVTPCFLFNSENDYYSLIYVHNHKIISDENGIDIGSVYILKLEKTNELLNELYKSKGFGKEEGMAKIHYLIERFVGYIHKNPTMNFGNNLNEIDIEEKEKELINKIKKITGIFAHGNTTIIEEKIKYVDYYDGFYEILKNLINKYI